MMTCRKSRLFAGGSRIAYSATHLLSGDTWVVPVQGGEPRLWLPNASGLVWIDESKVLFSEIKNKALHMGIVAAEESRAGHVTSICRPLGGAWRTALIRRPTVNRYCWWR